LNVVTLDRITPDYTYVTSGCSYARTLIYPPKMTDLYDSVTPLNHWSTDVINYESVCNTDEFDVKIWNMNIPWSENPAGLTNPSLGYPYFGSSSYIGTKEYLGYMSSSGQTFVDENKVVEDSVYYYDSFGDKIVVEPKEQKAIAIIHYTNQTIDFFYGEKFALEPFDPSNPDDTIGQARSFKLHIPWLMWHKNPNGVIGEVFYTDPLGFTSKNLFQVHYIESRKSINFNAPGLRYYHLWDTHPNTNGIPNRIGKVFPDLKIIVFDDDEIVAALNYKSNRSWTLPAPKLGLVTPNTFSGVLGGTQGLLTGNTETLFLTYRFNNSAFTNSLHCNYYQTITGNDQSLLPGASDILVRFGNEFPFLQAPSVGLPSGFTANEIKLLAQKVTTATTRPDVTQWREIDVTSQLSATTLGGYLTVTGLTGTTLQLTKNMYDTAPIYDLNDYITLPVLNQTGITLNFGGEFFFFGTIETDIQATIYVMNFLCNLGQTQFFDSSNPTWDGTTPPYVTEVALYNANKELMVISKIQSIEKRQGVQQYPIKYDF